ncbi:hypothetical protein MNB_SUP05-SYMBIONT-4-129 [hydrothermal vent metagenome]|uniref:Virulence plasmid A protein n=1 Tax=hydrothermal vent metagenome TaxID=652676 RepID=A0A1W1E099_9ZZZZ
MDIKTIDLFNHTILAKHNIIRDSEEWQQLAKQQRLIRLKITNDTATYLAGKGFQSANHIATMPLRKFLDICQDFSDSEELESAYKVAKTIRSASMHIMANVKNLHPSGHFSRTKAFTADIDASISFEALPNYEQLFGNLDYYECSEFSSIFGPAAYLLDLMRITQTYISDTNKTTIPTGLNFFDRRPDIALLALTEKNTTTEVLKLKIVNERVDALLQQLIPAAKTDYVAWLDTAAYPFNMPFCLPLVQIHAELKQTGLSLLTIYKTLQVEESYYFRELLALSPEQFALVTTGDVKRQSELWDEKTLSTLAQCDWFSRQANFDATNLVDLFQQNLNIETEKANAVNFYIGKHLNGYTTEHYFHITKDAKAGDSITNLNIKDKEAATADNLDMIGRFIRFSQYIGLSFQETDWLLNVAEFLIAGIAPYDSDVNKKRIDAFYGDHLKTVGKIYQLADLLQQPVTEILNSLGIIKTYGIGSGAVSEAPFDVIFNSVASDAPYHPIYTGNPDLYKDAVQVWNLSNKDIPASIANMLSQLGLGKVDLLELGAYVLKLLNISTQQLPLSVENLSLLYSYSSIANWLGISISELILISGTPKVSDDYKNPIDHLLLLVENAQWMKQHNTNIFKVNYVINGDINRYVDLRFHTKDFDAWLDSVKILITLKDGKLTDSVIVKLINSIADFLGTTQEIMTVLFDVKTKCMGNTTWITSFLTASSSTDNSLIIEFSRLLTLNQFLNISKPDLFLSISQYPSAYGFTTFPYSSTSKKIDISLPQLQGLIAFVDLQHKFKDAHGEFIYYLEEKNKKSSDADKILQNLTNWDATQIQTVSARYPKLGTNTAAFLILTDSIFALTSHLGDDVAMLFTLSDNTTASADTHAQMKAAEALLSAQLKSCYTPENLQIALQIISEEVLEKKRDVTVMVATWALTQAYVDVVSSNNLSEFLLIDVNVSAKIKTSYIKEAIDSIQLYLQRIKLDIEQYVVHMDIEEVWWQWISNYRIWEANREIYLYPENYLEPSLRKNQSKPFQDFSKSLLKSNITSESAEEAFKAYFQDIAQLTDLNYLSSYYTEVDNQAIYYFFAVSRAHPPKYYYCTYTYLLNENLDFDNQGTWSLWEEVGINIKGQNITPLYYAGKLMLFWVEIEKSSTSDVSSKTDANGNNNITTSRLDVYKGMVKYSILEDGGSWGSAQILVPEEIIYVDDKQGVGKNQLEKNQKVFNGVFTGMDSDKWNTVYVSEVEGDIIVYYGPTLTPVNESDALSPKAGMLVEEIPELVDFQEHLLKVLLKYNNFARLNFAVLGSICADNFVPYIDTKVFNEDLEQITVGLGGCFSSAPCLSPFLPNDNRFFIGNNVQNNSLYINLAANIYSNHQFAHSQADARTMVYNVKLRLLAFNALVSVLPNSITLAQVITNLTTNGYVEQSSSSYYATPKFANSDDQSAAVAKILGIDKATSEQYVAFFALLAVSGRENKALILFNNIDIKHSKQFAVKNKSGAFLHAHKNHSLLLNLQAKKAKQSGIISPDLFFYTHQITVVSLTTKYGYDARVKLFSELVTDKYILPLPTVKKDILTSSTTATALTVGFVDVKKFIDDMSVNDWKGLGDYLLRKKIVTTLQPLADAMIIAIMTGEPIISQHFFAESMVDTATIVDKNKKSVLIFTQLKNDNIIRVLDGFEDFGFLNSSKCINRGFGYFSDVMSHISPNPFITDAESDATFNQILNSNSLISLYNTPYQVPLPKIKSLNDCTDYNYDAMRLGTTAFARLKKQMAVEGINKVLTLENQQIPITLGNWFSDLQPIASTTAPVLLNGDQVDFSQGPYAQYYWELFFHAPILVAKNLSNQNKFEEAIDWLRHIFNPSQKSQYINLKTFSTEAPKQIDVATAGKIFTELQATKLDNNPYISANGSVNKKYKGNESLDFLVSKLKLNSVQVRIVRSVLSNYHVINPVNHYWNFQPFRNHTLQTLKTLLTNQASIRQYEDNPFDPFAIAQLRIGAFEKYVLMLYIDILIQWGDNLFAIDTRESINEATMLYLYAYDLLGKKPEDLGEKQAQKPANFVDIVKKYSTSSAIPEFLINMENSFHFENLPITKTTCQVFNDLPSYFCIPENSQLIARWNTVEDRLSKIHNSLDIHGNFQTLALFAPPINPLDLIRAAASGGNALSASSQSNKTVPIYRFAAIVQLTRQCIENVVSLGRLLEGNLEKYEAEDLSLLHTTQTGVMLNLVSSLKQDSIEQEQNTLNGLSSNLKSANDKKKYYDGLVKVGVSDYELAAQIVSDVSMGFTVASGIASASASIAFGVPQVGSPFALTYGGVQLGGTLSGIAQALGTTANIGNFVAQRLLTDGSYDRRQQEWVFSAAQAGEQAKEIGCQIAASKVRIKIAQQDLLNHSTQIQQNQDIADYLHNKFTNEELYQWLSGRVSALYHQQYQLALETAVLAQKAYQFELNSEQEFINIVYWDTAHRGLLAGESLLSSLVTMEQSYKTHLLDRKLEIEKTISLKAINPKALTDLKSDGLGAFDLDERLFDLDFPGHYQRQIKSISISIPAIIGPYQNLHATLSQSKNAVVLIPDIKAVQYLLDKGKGKDENIRHDWRSSQQIAISRGIEDAGVFQLDFKDELYLPFENTGVVSSWSLSMPTRNNAGIDYKSISDVIINLRYTAIAGSADFTTAVNGILGEPKAFHYDLKQSFANAWQGFMQDQSDTKKQQFKFNVNELQIADSMGLESVIVKITTSADIQIEAIDMLSLQIGNTVVGINNINHQPPKDENEEWVAQHWNANANNQPKDNQQVNVGWITELNLGKEASIDAMIDADWVLSFDLQAIKQSNFKAMLKDGFIDADKLLKIELLSLCFEQ